MNYDAIIYEATKNFFSNVNNWQNYLPRDICSLLVFNLENGVIRENTMRNNRGNTGMLPVPTKLPNYCIAQAILHKEHVRRIKFGMSDASLLCFYVSEGENEGIYIHDEQIIRSKIREYNISIDRKNIREVISILEENVPVVTPNQDPDLIALQNGIFNYKTKILEPFSPDIILTSKADVAYVPAAQNPVIHNPNDNTDWDVESWVASLSDDPDVVNLLWQLIGAVIRPHVCWHKTAFLYSEQGNNGKGTLCALLRNICGHKRCAAISIVDFSKDFMLEQLTKSLAVIVDENSTDVVVRDAANFKAAVTGDVIQINRKYKPAIDCRFQGMIVQCINALPKFDDSSESIYRRLMVIPFEKCFTGQERKYIKDDYLNRKEVLEYVVYRVLMLMPDYYEFDNVYACQKMLMQYKEFNDPIREFLNEMLPVFQWDLVPYAFLFDLYKAWRMKNYPASKTIGRNTFNKKIRQLLANDPTWEPLKNSVKPGTMMDKPEYLIVEWNLCDWQAPLYTGADINRKCRPMLKSSYAGIRRR